MAREISLSGGDISVIKALGLSGTPVDGQTLAGRLPHMESAELIDTLDGLMMLDYVLCDADSVRGAADLKTANFKTNLVVLRELREALTPQRKEAKSTRQRRG